MSHRDAPQALISTSSMAGPADALAAERRLQRRATLHELETEAVETALCAAAGATVGMLAGPLGAAAGAAVGGAIGAALAHQTVKAAREEADQEREMEAGNIEPLPTDTLPGMSIAELEAELEAPADRRS